MKGRFLLIRRKTHFYHSLIPYLIHLTRFPGPELLMTTKRDGDTSRTVPVNLFLSPDGKHDSGDVAGMLCGTGIAIRSIVVEKPTSIDTSSLNIRSDTKTPNPDLVAARRVRHIPVLQTAEIEGLLHELELLSLHNVTPTTTGNEPV